MHPLLDDYRPAARHYDELQQATGEPRPHWRGLLARLHRIAPTELGERQEFVARQIQENGITYNVYADPKGDARPWQLDALPQVLPAADWEALAEGVAQRARLLERVLADLYGEQRLLREGLLPPELVFGHDNFLWPAIGLLPRGGRWLLHYAVDLARAPDGRWWVLADRSQAPSGAGYALENRQIVARAFPELYRELGVRRLDAFFAAQREELLRLAAEGDTPPLVVLLTPGRYNETWFEHVYLARQLGLPLVEGQDLTVRERTLYLKTLGGLRRVHGVLRRLDDDWCDPLELRGDSALGVAGLLDVARAGRVLIANALGAGVLESPGLMGFLPAIAQSLLGESLRLPSVASWWCGEPPALEAALAALPRLLIKPAFPSQRFEPLDGAELDAGALAALRSRIRQRPQAYVAQERVPLSQAPVWAQGEPALEARAISMRVYAVASADGFQVMPGGLTRVAKAANAQIVSMQRGGGSKDTWVVGADLDAAPVPPRRIRALVREDPHLLSRTAENLYWLGRYCERCDGHARLLRSLLSRQMEADADAPPFAAGQRIATTLGLLPGEGLEQALYTAIADQAWGASLRADLGRLGWCATQVKARLSAENWRAIVELQREAAGLSGPAMHRARAAGFLNRLLIATTAQAGFALDDMTRDQSWRFLMVGRSLERLQFQSALLAAAQREQAPADMALLAWLLELGNSTITYRTRYLASPQPWPVLDLLLLDESNPHALIFQWARLLDTLRHLGFEANDLPEMNALPASLRALDLCALAEPGRAGAMHVQLADQLTQALGLLRVLSDRLMLRHFAHVADVAHSVWSA